MPLATPAHKIIIIIIAIPVTDYLRMIGKLCYTFLFSNQFNHLP